jgi:hypothetical protein
MQILMYVLNFGYSQTQLLDYDTAALENSGQLNKCSFEQNGSI